MTERIRITPENETQLFDRLQNRLLYYYYAARYPALRGTPLSLGRGAHVMISPKAEIRIGPGFAARRDLTLVIQGQLSIGRHMFCNRNVVLAAMQRVTIGDDVRLGERVTIIDHNHVVEPLDDLEARFAAYDTAVVTIGDRVLIGANTVVLPGAVIGDDSVIGAGSVVRGDVPPGVVAAGSPASVKRRLS